MTLMQNLIMLILKLETVFGLRQLATRSALASPTWVHKTHSMSTQKTKLNLTN